MKKVGVLGSTGTIGRLSLEVIKALPGMKVFGLAAHRNVNLLAVQTAEFRPDQAVVLNENQCKLLSSSSGTTVHCGAEALVDLASHPDVDILVVAMTGTAALRPVLAALQAGKRVALATKEILVGFGEMVMKTAEQTEGELLPIDSEHNAIHQCLEGRNPDTVKRLILTASGGPFLHKDFHGAGISQVLAHPTWNMGTRITVDSATLMNKGFEVIEAHHLFGIEPERISVLVHPQSVIHSMVEFRDGSILAQLSVPDMRLPIEYALVYPRRGPQIVPGLNLAQVYSLTFEEPDLERFSCLGLAYQALSKGGNTPAVLQAADQEAVKQFMKGNLSFERIPEVVAKALKDIVHKDSPSIDEIRESEREAKRIVLEECNADHT